MLAKVNSFGLLGIDAYPMEIEVDISSGLPVTTLVGLADTCIRESRERVKSAIKNSGFTWPEGRITVNLAPSEIKKEGASFDLAIALGILAATRQLNSRILEAYCILGELSLDGSLRPVQGVLSIGLSLAQSKIKNLLIPFQNAEEAGLVQETRVFALKSLKGTVEFLHNPESIRPLQINLDESFKNASGYTIDFSEVKGQFFAKRAMEIAVAGNHNILLVGPPGGGKTMLAKRIPTIMPALTLQEAVEVIKIHSAAGILPLKEGLSAKRPFRSPHHNISDVALAGGGSLPKPGEISLAHHGVLFLDELPEFKRNCLEAMRQPLEDKHIRISRAIGSFVFPANFMLVCAMNPCPCGNYNNPKKLCRCNPHKIANYMGKISGPLLDRIDIHMQMPAIKYKELTETKEAELSSVIKLRVERARAIQKQRFRAETCNAQMSTKLIRQYCQLDDESKELLRIAMTELGFSGRGFDKILRVSRTIADLAEEEFIQAEHVSEAIQYRCLDAGYGG